MKNILTQIKDWFTGADIARMHDESVQAATMRYARGNVSIQAGRMITKSDLDKLRVKGDKAHRKIKKA